MIKKRPVADVRRELRDLESQLTHVVIQRNCGHDKDEEIKSLRARIDNLKTGWPRAAQGPRTK